MAGYRDINSASTTIRRNVQGVDFQPDNRNALEAVAVALAASGRVNEFAVMMQSLEKVNSNANLATAIGDLTTIVASIKGKDDTDAMAKAGTLQDVGAQILKRLDALESK